MTSDQRQTPLADALAAISDRDLVRLLIPGHAADPGTAPLLAEYFGESLLRRDFGCLVTGLDKGPGSPLDQAQQLAAAAWGASRTWFLTNGASQGNRLAALALGQLGTAASPVVIQRSVHSSVIDGVILAGLEPVFAHPSVDRELGINHGVTAAELARVLDRHTDAKAVWIVSPSYFGAVADVAAIADVVHARGLPLIVDAAWGSHFGFHEALPANPLHLGADVVISSTHKAAGSLTQSAMVHLGHGSHARELEPLIERAFPLTASTSVSMPLLASLDIARASMVDARERIERTLTQTEALRVMMRGHDALGVVSDRFAQYPDIVGHDPLRVSVDVSGLGIHGNEVRERLAADHGVYVEIATHGALVAFFGPGYAPDSRRLVSALESMAVAGATGRELVSMRLPEPGPRRMSPREAFMHAGERVPLDRALGRISADSLAAYPPGIPNVVPGEELTADVLAFLSATATTPGGYVRGCVDAGLSTVRVVRG